MIPTHRLKVLDKTTNQKGEAGAGWLNPDGSITIQLNPCVFITPDRSKVLTLFPVGQKPKRENAK
ncbi:MAG: hypothetical protein KGL39_02895 [Patescibacteria group bacterium]|nr:hypothetical protein [Patescibacteria group bacterium]